MQFPEFFRTATGRSPYGFQTAFATAASLPDLLEAPRGSGKTATAVLGWLWRRQYGSPAQRTAGGRRLVFCLPMRTLVEQTERAVLGWRERLGRRDTLGVHVLLGGRVDDVWDEHPERDAILIGTQDQLLSRALMRGYAMSRYRWPMHFALLNSDCTWVMDEVQLMGVGASTAAQLQAFREQPAAGARTNPWDFVLLIEGALVLAAAATRRYESSGPVGLAFPFHARASGGLATLTDADEAENRGELWLPLWTAPATALELRHLFAEGRATVGTGTRARAATTAVDFARAVSALGVDRGIDGFIRVGFHVRNGLAYFATPLGRFATREIPSTRLLDDLDAGDWLERFRKQASSAQAPGRIALAKRRLERAIFEASRTGRLAGVLLELGATDQALGESPGFTDKALLRPVPRLSAAWAAEVLDDTPEQRLGAALASRIGMRARLIPLDDSGRNFGQADRAEQVFRERALVDNLHALLQREDIEDAQAKRAPMLTISAPRCTLSDIAAFIEGAVDDALIERWLRAAVLVDAGLRPRLPRLSRLPPATFAILALVHGRRVGGMALPRTATLLNRACAGDAVGATQAAVRRLIAAGRPVPFDSLFEARGRTRRIAAALGFPLSNDQLGTLERRVLAEPKFEHTMTHDGLPQEQT